MDTRYKWKIKNLGYIGYLKYLFLKKQYIICNNEYIFKYDSKNYKPFMLVKPSGVKKINRIIAILNKRNHRVIGKITIHNYNKLIPDLFPMINPREEAYWRQINNKYYKIKNEVIGYILLFDDVSIADLNKDKIYIRRKCGIDFYIILDGKHAPYETSITPVHVPDDANFKTEYKIILDFIKKRSERN